MSKELSREHATGTASNAAGAGVAHSGTCGRSAASNASASICPCPCTDTAFSSSAIVPAARPVGATPPAATSCATKCFVSASFGPSAAACQTSLNQGNAGESSQIDAGSWSDAEITALDVSSHSPFGYAARAVDCGTSIVSGAVPNKHQTATSCIVHVRHVPETSAVDAGPGLGSESAGVASTVEGEPSPSTRVVTSETIPAVTSSSPTAAAVPAEDIGGGLHAPADVSDAFKAVCGAGDVEYFSPPRLMLNDSKLSAVELTCQIMVEV